MGKWINTAQADGPENPLASQDAGQGFRQIMCYIEAGAAMCLAAYGIVLLVALTG